MKITASKVSAVLFTFTAIAAFTWMTLRPNVNAQIAGFAMPAGEKVSASAEEVTTTPSADVTSEEQNIEKDKIEVTAEKKKATEATVGTTPAETASTSQEEEQKNSEADDIQTPIEPVSDESSKDEVTEEAVNDSSTSSSEVPEAEQAVDPEPVTLEENKAKEEQADEQAMVKKKTNSENSAEFANKNTVVDGVLKAESATSSTITKQTETLDSAVENLTNEELKAESVVNTEAEIKVASLTNSDAVGGTSDQEAPIPQAAGDETALTTYIPAENARGTVVVLHGCDYQPDLQNSIVQTLRNNLPKVGWNTLLFQLPPLSNTSNYQDLDIVMPDAAAAIESAIAIAKERSQTPVVLLAHGCGSHMALAWMEVKGNASIDAYIGIGTGMMNTSIKDTQHLRNPLEKMKFPQLDIFGSADNETVLKTAPERLGHINRASNPASRQRIIANADHNMTGKTEQLSKIITKWLNKKAFIDK